MHCVSFRSRVRRSVLVACAAASVAACGSSTRGPIVRVTIPPGASVRTAADSLERAGLVSWPRIFRYYAKVTGNDHDIKAGTYSLRSGESWSQLLTALRDGEGLERRLTIPEGWNLFNIVPALATALGAPPESVSVAVRDTALLHELDIPTQTVEGYLFPDTYIFAYGTSPRVAVREMVTRFEHVWDPAWDDRLQQLAMSRNDIMALASIIEREARRAEERPVISAVYHNRLQLSDAAPGRSYRRIRPRRASRPAVLQGSRSRVTVQHVSASGASSGSDRVAWKGEH